MGYIAAVALLLAIGLIFNVPLLVYCGYALGGIFFLARWLSNRWIRDAIASRKLSRSEIEIGETVEVTIELNNEGRVWIPWLLVEEVLPKSAIFGPPPSLLIEGHRVMLTKLRGGETKKIVYRAKALRRGYFQLGPVVLETGDFLGLYRRFRVASEPLFLLVLPKVIPILGYNIASRRPVGEVKVTYRLFEDPTLMAGIRRYQLGDPIRRIHWGATAKTGHLQSKVYQPTSVAGATLVVDMHRASNPDRHEPIRTDLAVTAAASLCHLLFQMQQPFGLISNGRDAADRIRLDGWESDLRTRDTALQSAAMEEKSDRLRPVVVPPQRGVENFNQVLRTLARLERTDGLRLPELLAETQSRIPRDTSVVVLLQELDERSALALGMLRQQGYAVSAIINSYEDEAFASTAGMLVAQRISVYRLKDEAAISQLCETMLINS
ncbi:MAG: hypothetical protein RLY14_2685 [Planctomycetota bacterium]|jgi:uncharacterized protein (DUF58 family)